MKNHPSNQKRGQNTGRSNYKNYFVVAWNVPDQSVGLPDSNLSLMLA